MVANYADPVAREKFNREVDEAAAQAVAKQFVEVLIAPSFTEEAKAARPDAPVICLTGDGGFAHVWAEIETAKRMNLPVVVVVLNNQILGYQKHAELSIFGAHTDVVHFQPVDHAAIAKACGYGGDILLVEHG